MSRGVKAFGIVVSLILLSVILPITVVTSPYLSNSFIQNSWGFFEDFFLSYFFQQYIFWVSSFFILLLIIFILVLIFYPKVKRTFPLSSKGGELTLNIKAIEGLVRSKLNTKNFVSEPKVTVKGTKDKIQVKVKGRLKRTSSLVGQTEVLMEGIRQELRQVLGSNEKVSIYVEYVDLDRKKQESSQPRVE